MDRENVSVVVVGAGPAGLATAITLGRYGVDCLLVERRAQPSPLPRATVLSTRTMELVRSWGLEERVLAGGVDVDWLMWSCTTLAEASEGAAVEVGLPTRAQARLVSPTAPACVPQDHLEHVLLSELGSIPNVDVARRTELVGLERVEDGVRVALRAAGGGEEHEVLARYVVAADGAHSGIRSALDIRMLGSADVLGGVSALLRAPLWSTLGERRYGIDAIQHPAAESIFLPAGPDDRWGYYGTDDLYLAELARFLKPEGVVAIAGAGLLRELDGPVPGHLKEWWEPSQFCCLHSAEWWRRHWDRTGIVSVEHADAMADGWLFWLAWQQEVAPGNTVEIAAVEADAGALLGYVRAVGRKRPGVRLDEPITAIPERYERHPLLREEGS